MKRFMVAILAALFLFSLGGCSGIMEATTTEYAPGEKILLNQFVVIEEKYEPGEGTLYTAYDKDTHAMYYVFHSEYKCGISEIYEEDGSGKVKYYNA